MKSGVNVFAHLKWVVTRIEIGYCTACTVRVLLP